MDDKLKDGVFGFVHNGGLGERLPKTLTMKDIERFYGIKRDKWRNGVKEGIFPQPLLAFKRPKRWLTEEVDASLYKEDC